MSPPTPYSLANLISNIHPAKLQAGVKIIPYTIISRCGKMHAFQWLITTKPLLEHKCTFMTFFPLSTINNMRRCEPLKLYHRHFKKIMYTVLRK